MITDTAIHSDEVAINAPVELVWKILLDFKNYENWNPFCPTAINDSLELGSPIEMMVDLGEGPQRQIEFISRVDPYVCIAWAMDNKPGDPVHAERSQYLNRTSDTSCTYVSIDIFSGPEMAGMIHHFGKSVEAGFNRCAYGLKNYAEQLFQENTQGV